MLTVIILTYNEELHVGRAIRSVQAIARRVLVVDCGSTDRTVEIATELGAEVRFNPWRNHADQFNWALDQLPAETGWVFRLDADEIVSEELRQEISATLPRLGPEIDGVVVGRRNTFLGRRMRYGGIFPVRLLRIFRHGRGRSEERWMDEHIKVTGPVAYLSGELLDDNLNSLTWWTEKHNRYASREVVDVLGSEFGFASQGSAAELGDRQTARKRWVKENIYVLLPGGLRAFAYFFYRYIIRLGFLDGTEGLAFHVLQGFWYRFLVDAKLHEVRRYMARTGKDAPTAIREVLGIDLEPARLEQRMS